MKTLLATLPILATLLATSCADTTKKVTTLNSSITYDIDTIVIHGQRHEIITQKGTRAYNGFMHSPECWCQKGGQQ